MSEDSFPSYGESARLPGGWTSNTRTCDAEVPGSFPQAHHIVKFIRSAIPIRFESSRQPVAGSTGKLHTSRADVSRSEDGLERKW